RIDEVELVPLIATAPSLEAVVERLGGRQASARVENDRQWQLLLTEFRLHALRDPEVRPPLAASEQAPRAAYCATADPLLRATAPSLEAVVERLGGRQASARVENDRQWQLLLTEFRLHALRDPEVRPRLAAWEQAQRAAYCAAVEHLFRASGLEPPADPDLIA